MKAARKVKVTPITHLSEDVVKYKVLEMDQLRRDIKQLKKQYVALGAELVAHLGPKGVRQYDNVKFQVMQKLARDITWKTEASRLAKLLYPKAAQFRIYLRHLARLYPKKLSKPFPRLFDLKDGSEVEE